MKTFFPFTIRFPRTFTEIFLANKPKDMTFYEFDVKVRGKTSVTFIVYDIKDNFHGGRGKEIKKIPVNKIPKKDIEPLIDEQVRHMSYEIQNERQIDKEEYERFKIANEIRKEFL